MKDALLIADLHLHRAYEWRFNWNTKFLDKLLVSDNNGKDLYLLGDVFENRDKVDSRVLNQFMNFVLQWKGTVVWIAGQHDSYAPGRATLESLSRTSHIVPVDRDVYNHNDCWFVPYCRKDEDYRALLSKVPDNTVVFTHLPIKEVLDKINGDDNDTISIKEYARFKEVYAGDIHGKMDLENFHYVGAPSQRDRRDKGIEGYIGRLINGKFTREKTMCPIHIEVRSEKDIVKDRECIISIERGSTLNIPKDNVLEVVQRVEMKKDSLKISIGESDDVILKEYIKKSGTTLPQEQLMAAAREYLRQYEPN